jgi:hypothetical protein
MGRFIKRSIRKFIRRFIIEEATADHVRPAVAIAKWKNNACSPVMLMIDDFTNAWVADPGNPIPSPRCDWGGRLDHENSIFNFLEDNLLQKFPEVRTTFFTVIGEISQYNISEPFDYARPINSDADSIRFFKKVFNDPRFEIAYHGFNHGTPGETTEKFVQEWDGFSSLDEALERIKEGKEIFQNVFGEPPRGGKYGGWCYNRFGDESIDRSGFDWWCRDWMPKDPDGSILPEYFEARFFGKNKVVAMPATVHGQNWSKRQLNCLLKHQQIISIEEHMGCLRPDKRVQTPNVYDDMSSLQAIYRFLRTKNVWHATGSEIAAYADTYMNTTISDIGEDCFQVSYAGKNPDAMLTIIIQPLKNIFRSSQSRIVIVQPDGQEIAGEKVENKFFYHFNINIKSGKYKLKVC